MRYMQPNASEVCTSACTSGHFPADWKRKCFVLWSGRGDLNARPPAPKAGALPGCATPRHVKLS